MICSRPVATCPECADALIHQGNRGRHESSSSFGQFIHDELGNDFWIADIDGAIYKLSTRVLRIIEHKKPGGAPSGGQKAILALLATAVYFLRLVKLVHKQSGVFVIRSEHPHDRGHIEPVAGSRVAGFRPAGAGKSYDLDGDQWRAFLSGQVLDG